MYKPVASELLVQSELLLRGSHIIILPALQEDILVKLYTGHLGMLRGQNNWYGGQKLVSKYKKYRNVLCVVSIATRV